MHGGVIFVARQDKARGDKARQCVALHQPRKTRKVFPGFEKYCTFAVRSYSSGDFGGCCNEPLGMMINPSGLVHTNIGSIIELRAQGHMSAHQTLYEIRVEVTSMEYNSWIQLEISRWNIPRWVDILYWKLDIRMCNVQCLIFCFTFPATIESANSVEGFPFKLPGVYIPPTAPQNSCNEQLCKIISPYHLSGTVMQASWSDAPSYITSIHCNSVVLERCHDVNYSQHWLLLSHRFLSFFGRQIIYTLQAKNLLTFIIPKNISAVWYWLVYVSTTFFCKTIVL